MLVNLQHRACRVSLHVLTPFSIVMCHTQESKVHVYFQSEYRSTMCEHEPEQLQGTVLEWNSGMVLCVNILQEKDDRMQESNS